MGGLGVGEIEFIDVGAIGLGPFDGVEVFALNVFDQRPFGLMFFRGVVADDGGYGSEAGEFGGFGATMASDKLITWRVGIGKGLDDDRLKHAGMFDRVGEFPQGGGIHRDAGLMGVRYRRGRISMIHGFVDFGRIMEGGQCQHLVPETQR